MLLFWYLAFSRECIRFCGQPFKNVYFEPLHQILERPENKFNTPGFTTWKTDFLRSLLYLYLYFKWKEPKRNRKVIWLKKVSYVSNRGINYNWSKKHINLVILELMDTKLFSLKLREILLKKWKQKCYIF